MPYERNQNLGLTDKKPLLRFLPNTSTLDNIEYYESIEDEPIAEMFSNTTVIFVDIPGFTSWSSEQEPSMVFKLLETLYSAFDLIAKNHNVFKVKTIGDCYVAVTGLPEPDKNHVVSCNKFARQCLVAMEVLTQELEITSSPGTSDLGLQIGLHLGPITAGVLRSDQPRLQLFGDTMNMASCMESTSKAGKIHVLEGTASLLPQRDMLDWLVK